MKKIICVFITAALILGMIPSAFGASATTVYDESNAILLSKTLNIMVGDTDGNLRLDNYVSRAEFTKIAIAMSQYRNMVPPSSTTSFFKDCSFKHWAASYVRLAVTNGLITGYPDGTFRPEDTVLLEEAVTVMLKLLGFTSEDFGSSWPYGQIGIATNEHVLDNITCQVGGEMTRREVLKLIYNTLIAKPKTASVDTKYLQSLNCNVYEDAVLIATNRENDGVTPGYVLTSEGTFKIGNDFNHDLIGRKGDLVVINNNDYAAFMQSVQTVQKHVVYSLLDKSVITYSNGTMSSFEIDDSIAVYQDTNKTTFGAVRNSLSVGDTVYLMRNASGNVDYISLTTDNMSGPYTVGGKSHLAKLGIDTDSAIVMRDGVKTTSDSISANDIVYYLADINTVFAYSRKITGVYEKASPNKDMPTSVTVSGVSYTIESPAAFDKLSSNGKCKLGDTVTLLLGKDGQIADVLTSTEAVQEDIVGYLVSTGTKEFANANDERYTSMYATLVKPDGTEFEVVTNKLYDNFINYIMKVELDNGVATLKAYNEDTKKSGKVNAKNMTIDGTPVNENVEILDVTDYKVGDPGAYIRTYMQRLDGINLTDKNILYMNKNNRGEIDKLILLNATGDAYSYGIGIVHTPATRDDNGKLIETQKENRTYKCILDGKEYTCKNNYGGLFKSGSAVGAIVKNGSVSSVISLIKNGEVSKISDGYVKANGETYTMSDSVVAYKSYMFMGETTFNIIPVSELKGNEDKYTITAYSDKAATAGGRVRLLIVKEK